MMPMKMMRWSASKLGFLSVLDDPSLVDVLAGQADVSSGSFAVPVRNGNMLAIVGPDDLTSFLRGVVFVSQAPLSARLDVQRISLGAISLAVRGYRCAGLARNMRSNTQSSKGGARTLGKEVATKHCRH